MLETTAARMLTQGCVSSHDRFLLCCCPHPLTSLGPGERPSVGAGGSLTFSVLEASYLMIQTQSDVTFTPSGEAGLTGGELTGATPNQRPGPRSRYVSLLGQDEGTELWDRLPDSPFLHVSLIKADLGHT